jgi:coenzyme F420-0:L-glutamate ligase/coenzyme F420-1:gamma-L-glutamate ligase
VYNSADSLTLVALQNFPLVQADDDIGEIILDLLHKQELKLEQSDILVIAQKIISKAERRLVFLDEVVPSAKAKELATTCNKDPRVIELILNESRDIIRVRDGLIIAEHKLGMIMANAGIDQSNIGDYQDRPAVLLLPVNPDRSAQNIRNKIQETCGNSPGIIINDSIGRAWRNGITGHAIGSAGLSSLIDQRGRVDLFGRVLDHTEVAHADECAAAASLLMGQADEGKPVVLIQGLNINTDTIHGETADLIRDKSTDLFR